MKIAIVIHAFYPEQLKVILGKIQMILRKNYHHTIDVCITLPFVKKSLQSIIESYSFPISIHWCENKGMDLLPFFELIPNLQHYDWILKLHTKNNDGELNQLWFETLIDELVGSPDVFQKTIAILEQNQDWKMAGILPFFLSAHKLMLKNQENVDKLAKLWALNTDKDWGFFAGSFYWIKPQVLNPYAQTLLEQREWFDDEFAKDGLLAHAVERLISLIIGQIGKIGLLYGYTELCIDSRHKFTINQAFSHQLLENIQNLDKIVRILTEVYPLDIKKYERACGISFLSDELALRHYGLIGQFGDCADLILPISLQRKQEKLFSWHKLKNKQRTKGLVSIVIPVLNEIKLTLVCLKSIKKYTKYANIEVIVVDNGSDFLASRSLNLYAMTDKKCKIIHLDENLNFAVGCNYGFSQSSGEYVLFLNNDTLVTEYWLTPLIEVVKNSEILAVQPLLLYPNNTVQCAGVEFGGNGFGFSKYEKRSNQDPEVLKSQSRSALTGACLLLRANDFIGIKGFSSWFINGQEDMDLCLRLQNLYPNKQFWYCAESKVYHYESSTVGRKSSIAKNRQIFQIFWYSLFKNKVNPMSERSILSLANTAMRNGWYKLAENLYFLAYEKDEKLKNIIQFNLNFLNSQQKNIVLDLSADVLGNTDNKVIKDYLLNYKKKSVCSLSIMDSINISDVDGIFLSLNNDPLFFTNEVSGFNVGFYGISFILFANKGLVGQIAKLYVDYGNGFSEDDSFAFSVKNGFNTRVIYLDKKPISIRFDPLELETQFSLMNFEISELNQFGLENYFLREVRRLKKAIPENKKSLIDLYNYYNNCVSTLDNQGSYQEWIEINECDNPNILEIKSVEGKFSDCVLFSIVIPTYNTEERYLRECLDSILNQSFSNFEICVADDNSPNIRVREVLSEYQNRDKRVKVIFRENNGHISEASNSALSLSVGKFIVLVDHDDVLAENALYYVAKAIIENPNVKIIYSDEDKIDEIGNRSNPHFKSDWNPDLFYSQNYVSHLGVYSNEIIRKIGGFRKGVEGSQDQDLLLRCLPYVNHQEIFHIPKVLYHWRMIVGSTASGAGEKSYTTGAGIRALTDYFDKNGPSGVVVEQGFVPNTYKVNWPIPNPAPKVSLLIPTRDGKDITEQAVRSILEKTTYPNYDILIIDNGSEKAETLEFFEQIQKEDSRVRVIRYDYPFNYSAINNFGVKHTDGEIIGLINNDVEVISPEWLTEMVSHAIRPDIGCVGAKLYYSNDTIQHAGVITSLGGVAGHSHKHHPRNSVGYFHRLVLVQNLTAVTAACLLVKRTIYNEVGGLNEKDLTVAFNDVDFCLKVHSAGYRNLWTPYAELYHHESISRGAEDNPEKIARFNREIAYMQKTWTKLLERDPCYSPNLTKAREDFSINL